MNIESIGKRIIIGIRFFDDNQNLLEQYQTDGIISTITDRRIVVERNGEPDFYLPNDDRAIMKAEQGVYRMRSTGREVVNPDFMAQWSVRDITETANIEIHKQHGFKVKE